MVTSPGYPFLFWTIFLTVSYWCWFLLEVRLLIRDRGAAGVTSRWWLVCWIGTGVVLGVFVVPYFVPFFKIRIWTVVFIGLGGILIWAGMLLRVWAIWTLGRFFKTKVVIQGDHNLIRSGPYRYLRNPSYTGILVTSVGFGLGIGNWLSTALLLTAALVGLGRRIGIEEAALAARFGKDYEAYRRGTWTLIPFVW